jgi:putative tricarboxylic transport membrane protein
VLGGLVLFSLAALFLKRRGVSDDGGVPSAFGATPIVLVGVGVGLHLLLAERAGFMVAATVLFWCTARAFDHRHPVRDLVAAVAMSLASYVLFARVLQLSLP